MPNPAEVASVRVNALEFHDWDTVWVQHRHADAWPHFKFTCAERDPIPDLWSLLQFTPGDFCTIWLGGQQAINGIILNRQVAYDAKNHGVQLSGRGLTWAAAASSVASEHGSFDQMTHEQIARKVLAPFPSGIRVIGKLNDFKFDGVQVQPGQLVWDFLENLARQVGHVMGSDHLGNITLIGEHTSPVVQQLIEGYNILKCQAVYNIEFKSSEYATLGQNRGSDDKNGAPVNEQKAVIPGTLGIPKFLQFMTEQPVKAPEQMQMRAYYEKIWREGAVLEVSITVQGWLRDGISLWRTGDNVFVHSPMAMLDMVLKIQTATFTQDSRGGTTTTLDLVLPWKLRDTPYRVNKATGFSEPDKNEVKTDDAPTQAPPPAWTTEPEFKEPEAAPDSDQATHSGINY